MFMPKYDFEHYDSTETPQRLSFYFYFRSYFYYYSTRSLFHAFFPLMNSQSFFNLHSFTLLSKFVCQAICFTFFSLVSVATIYFPVLFFFDFPYCGCNLFLPHLIIVLHCVPIFVTVTLFADNTQVIFIYISVTYDNMFFFLYSTSFYA